MNKLTALLFTLTSSATGALANTSTSAFDKLLNLQNDGDWATGVVSIPASTGPAWAIVEKTGHQYRYSGCASRLQDIPIVENIRVENDRIIFSIRQLSGYKLSDNISPQLIDKTSWLNKTEKPEAELRYIASVCEFKQPIQHWREINRNNLKRLKSANAEAVFKSNSLFEFQPVLDTIEPIEQQINGDTKIRLFRIQLSGNQRSGYCGSHPDEGFYLAKLVKRDNQWVLANDQLIVTNHCISSQRYNYLGKSPSGFEFVQKTDTATAPVFHCFAITPKFNKLNRNCPSQ